MTQTPDVIVCPHGPILVRGIGAVEDATGVVHDTERPIVAICACGQTSLPPWCDGTHKLLGK